MKRILVTFLIFSLLISQFSFLIPYAYAASSPWTQTDWSGGSGSSTTNQFSDSSSVTTSTAGQFTLTNSEKLTNTTFESDITNWNTGVQPDSISGIKLWLKADAITGKSDGNAISSWNDSSGNSNNATQATGGSQPLYKTSIINSQPVVRFDGINDTIGSGFDISPGTNPNITVFVVANSTTNANSPLRKLWGHDNGGFDRAIGLDSRSGTNFGYFSGTGVGSYFTLSASTNYILSQNYTTSTFSGWVNGTNNVNAAAVSNGGGGSTIYLGSVGGVGEYWSGDVAEFILFNSTLSSANRTRIENYLRDKYAITVSSGITSATRSTTQAHGGIASAKLVTSSADTGEFTQTVNVGDTNAYNLSAYAYTTGAAVTSSDVELFYNGSTVSTTYTSAGGGWYQLTGTVTGANASRIYGVQVKANKTVYVDDMSLNGYASSGSLTSAIFDTAQRSDWGTLTYNATVPANAAVSIKARTSNSSDMTGATAFSSCSAITSGSDISSNSCVTDTHRYIQYEVSLTSTDTATATATFQDVSIVYSLSVPDAPSSLAGSPSTSSITWSWTDNSTDEDGFYIQDTDGNTKCTVSSASTTTCTESSLTPNTSYTRRVVAYNASGNSSASSNASAITLSTAPNTSNITSNRSTSTWYNTASFVFTNGIGFGAGEVEYFRYAWNTSSTHTWSGSETQWTSGTLTQTATSDSNSWYLHLKGYNSADVENGTLDLGPFYYDATNPNTFDLDSPADNIFTNSSRPTFKWKAASTGDALAGLNKYKFQLDTASGNYITVDNISVSGTANTETNQYIVQYEGFSDSDNTNNYISIYTKSSSSWGSSENDGKLKEGKNTWRITAVDNAGNSVDSSRTIYADYTNPALSNITLSSADKVGVKDGYSIATTTTPTLSGTISDSVASDKVLVNVYKQNFFLGIETNQTLELSTTYSLNNTANTAELNFNFTVPQEIDYGKYHVSLTGVDKAENQSIPVTVFIQILTDSQAKTLLTQTNEEKETDFPKTTDRYPLN